MSSQVPANAATIKLASPRREVPPTRPAKPPHQAPVVPVWLRLLPDSAFPIRSQADLAGKISHLLLALTPGKAVVPTAGHGLPHSPQAPRRKT
jgi:hypothetical protein